VRIDAGCFLADSPGANTSGEWCAVRLGDERGVFFYRRVKSRQLARGFSLALLWQEAIRGNLRDAFSAVHGEDSWYCRLVKVALYIEL
jgi:hypothetical protein